MCPGRWYREIPQPIQQPVVPVGRTTLGDSVTQTLSCARCKRKPEAIPEYQSLAIEEGMSPDEYVLAQEGTLDIASGQFLCDECYVAVGQPSRRMFRWTATPENLAELNLS